MLDVRRSFFFFGTFTFFKLPAGAVFREKWARGMLSGTAAELGSPAQKRCTTLMGASTKGEIRNRLRF